MKANLKLAIIGISILILSSSFVNTKHKLLRTITGAVIYSNEFPSPSPPNIESYVLPGVVIQAYAGTTLLPSIATSTDIDGNYEISLPSNVTTLRFLYIGLHSVDITLSSKTVEDVIMTDRDLYE